MKVNDLDVTVKSETFWGMSAKWVSSAFHLTTLQSPGPCCQRDPLFYFRMPKVEAESWLCLPTVVYCVYLGGHLSSDISPGNHPLPQISDLGTYPVLVIAGGDHWRPIQTCWFGGLTPPRVTSGNGNWNWSTCGFQADSMHPTEILSCSCTCLSLSLPWCYCLLWRIVSEVFRWDLCCFLGD